jgi:MraZ protein
VRGFHGEYPRTLDTKNRVQLPAKWKKDLPEDLVFVPFTAHDEFRSVRLFSEEGFATFIEAIFAPEGGYQPNNQDHIDRRAYYSMEARQVQQDSVGRVVIPAELRDFANLDRELVAAGEWDYLSLWNPDVHRRYKEQAKAKAAFKPGRPPEMS